MTLIKKIPVNKIFIILIILFTCNSIHSQSAAKLKPRLVVLTDIAPNNIEPADHESLVRLLAYADRFEIEPLIAGSGWNSSNCAYPTFWINIIKTTISLLFQL
jgi:hypothetical protein